jgi:glycosyltransferase involved in cell wall biosynthesis
VNARKLSVILCTHNPDRVLLAQVTAAISDQLDNQRHEFILVDNNSVPPLDGNEPSLRDRSIRIVHESRQGLSSARCAGIEVARGQVLVFLDDDNVPAPDYLANAETIARLEPNLGAFAGKSIGRFEAPPGWLHINHLARYAVRDLGDVPLAGSGARWAVWEPFGAGLVVRRDVAEAFVKLNRALEDGLPLGRVGSQLGSGEDSLFSRIADQLGYQVAYRPELSLEHVISRDRLTVSYLFKLIEGQARSHVLLEAISGRLAGAPRPNWFALHLLRRFLSRLRNPGLHEAISHIWWDIGYYSERAKLQDGRTAILAKQLNALKPVRGS